jgi:general secretion pathway protein E
MIGEIRDKKSLQIAIQAALTGHLVLATLHTNDAPSTINRLLDLETKPFLIASTIKAIISQRLIRKLCPHCKQETLINGKVYFDAIGCKECELSGFHGRDIISEIFVIDEQISSMISSKRNLKDIVSYAKTKGYKKLLESGFEKVKNGITTSQEVYRTTRY